jgi:hypothetical protein
VSAPTSSPAEARPTSIALAEPVATEVPVGGRFALKARVIAADDLRGARVELGFDGARVATREIVAVRDGAGETEAFDVAAPDRAGTFTWTLTFPRQDVGGVTYAQSTIAVPVTVEPLRTSLAVWSVPAPVVTGARFRITVGAKSAGGVALAGAPIAIRDQHGVTAGEGRLGDTPWPGTDALYWTEIELTAPGAAGVFAWTAAFAATDLALPHRAGATSFGFAAVAPAAHRVTVAVTCAGAPVGKVQIALGPHRAATDSDGIAIIAVPGGTHPLAAWHAEYEAFVRPLEVTRDTSVAVALTRLPEVLTVWG